MTKNSEYIFQRKKVNFTKRLFANGLNISTFILFTIKNSKETFSQVFLAGLPDSYPGFKLLKSMFGYNSKKGFKKHSIRANISRLKKHGLIKEDRNKEFCLTITGKELISYIENRHSVFEKPWDKKIRMVIFDIPEKEKRLRQWFRAELGLLAFKQLQKSVYIGKYPFPNDLYQNLIKNNLFNSVHIFTINEADKQKKLIQLLEKE
ncbi:MAG: hypothetical protein WBC21_04295 [Minisyncoccales bacterium]